MENNKEMNDTNVKLFLTIILLYGCLTGFCQVDLFFPLNNELDWANFEKQNHELKTRFIKSQPNEFEYYRLNEKYTPTLSDLENHLHIIDFNGDGIDDIIFHGESGSEAKQIMIFINTGQSFVKIFTDYQEIHKLTFINGKAHQLFIQDGGCCCDYTGIKKNYIIDYSSELPEINLISQLKYIDRLEYPSQYFEKPVKFEVLNDKYNIRFSPVIDDITEVFYCGEPQNGNSLGKIKSGSTGYALAEQVDTTGRIWWYVAMLPQSEIYEAMYHDDVINPDFYKLGWISSRFVKEIKEQ